MSGMDMDELAPDLEAAVQAMAHARVWIVTAGAGMGVDSGLPDFRGPEGFWRAYPPYRKLGLDFYSVANPVHFESDPALAWGFYGHRLGMYRRAQPHDGFRILQDLARLQGSALFAVTSNVDGHFQKAGFDPERVYEVHGSIHHLQCVRPCRQEVWNNREEVPVDQDTMRALRWPLCPYCGRVARPNILMFGDPSWVSSRSEAQARRFQRFLDQNHGSEMIVLEFGAGTAVPTIRHLGSRLVQDWGARLIRVNPGEPQVESPHIGLACGSLAALQAWERRLRS